MARVRESGGKTGTTVERILNMMMMMMAASLGRGLSR